MLLNTRRALIPELRAELKPMLESISRSDKAFHTLSTVFKRVVEHPKLGTIHLIIDALDECQDGLSNLLPLITELVYNSRIKWIISNRNKLRIEEHLGHRFPQEVVVSLELNKASVSGAVAIYVKKKVKELTERKGYGKDTRKEIQNYLLENSKGTFLWVALVCDILQKTHIDATTKMKDFPTGLAPLYRQMLDQVLSSESEPKFCVPVLKHMIIACEPLTIAELESLTAELKDLSTNDVSKAIRLCGSFLTVQQSKIYFVHKSAKDFLSDDKRLSEFWPGGLAAMHLEILERSISNMTDTLRKNTLGLDPDTPANDKICDGESHLARVRYSCLYWTDHASAIAEGESWALSSREKILKFLERHFLHWLESLSLLGNFSKGILAVRRLLVALQVSSHYTPVNL